jgi:predicted MPP superfamily phosphohydrolase
MQPEKYRNLWEKYSRAIQHANIIFLDDQSVELSNLNIRITGLSLERPYYKRWAKRILPEQYLEEKIGKSRENCFQILLAHNPEFFRDYAKWDPDLVLSGHIHGGVVRLPFLGGVIAPSMRLFPHYTGGIYHEFGHQMILGKGLGMHTIPIRIWNPGELVAVEIRKKKTED